MYIGLILFVIEIIQVTGTSVPFWFGLLIAVLVGILYPRIVVIIGVAPERRVWKVIRPESIAWHCRFGRIAGDTSPANPPAFSTVYRPFGVSELPSTLQS